LLSGVRLVNELDLPVGVEGNDVADEFIRFWIDDNDEYVSLRVGSLGKDEPSQWGMMLADLSLHILNALKQNGSTDSEEALRLQLEQGYVGRLKAKNANISGSLLGTKQ
jgi:hypothetical protein